MRFVWMHFRYFCCKYGWYSFLVAFTVTIGCLLSLYSLASCQLLELEIGFEPNNRAWNESSLQLGFWYYYNETATDHLISSSLFESCHRYSDEFQTTFIDKDRTWTVARVMGLIAALASLLSTLLAWLFCITPCCSVNYFWPTLLLPLTMIAFIAEGSKFLIFDVGLCRNSIWTPSGVDSQPQHAESCSLGQSSYFGIAAGAVFLLATLLVCIRVPNERELDPNYGVVNDEEVEAHNSIISKDYPKSEAVVDEEQVVKDTVYHPSDVSSEASSSYNSHAFTTKTNDQVSESRMQIVAKLQQQAMDNNEDLDKFVSDLQDEFTTNQ